MESPWEINDMAQLVYIQYLCLLSIVGGGGVGLNLQSQAADILRKFELKNFTTFSQFCTRVKTSGRRAPFGAQKRPSGACDN